MIVKVQRSLATSEDVPQVLIYDRDRSVRLEGPLSDELARAMGADVKLYFEAEVVGDQLVLQGPAPEQVW